MGSAESVKQKIRSSTWESLAESIWQDIRYGARQLVHSPGFSVVALITLALGIGANTAIFTLVHAVLLRQLQIADPAHLYRIGEGEYYCCDWGGFEDNWGTFEYPFYQHVRDTGTAFREVAAFSGSTPAFGIRRAGAMTAAQTMVGEQVSGNYFDTLGLQPFAGRLIAPSDDTQNAAPVAVLGYRAWIEDFGGDQTILGSTVLVNELPVTVIGIAPPGFHGDRLTATQPELWMPLNMEPLFESLGQNRAQSTLLNTPGDAWLYLVGRLNAGVTPAQAEAGVTADLQHWLVDHRHPSAADLARIPRQHVRITAGGTGISSFRSSSRTGLYLLSAASALVLLVACANLANLLLARSAARRRQTALRLSLGATRARIIRAVLTESLLLSLLGGIAGLALAFAGTRGILAIVFRGAAQVPVSATPSLPVLGFALLLSLVTGAIFATVPAWTAAHAEPQEGLRAANTGAVSLNPRTQKILVVIQAALSVVLLAIGGLVTESLRNLETANFGFETHGRLLAFTSFRSAGYQAAQLPAIYRQIQDRLEALPGVRSAALAMNSPQASCCATIDISIDGRTDKGIGDIDTLFERVSPRYFATLGIPLLAGRDFTASDTQDAPQVAIVDETFARAFFHRESPLGKRFGLELAGHAADYTIVGVAGAAKYRPPGSPQGPAFFLPFTQTTQYAPTGYQRFEAGSHYAQVIALNVAGPPESYEKALREVLASIDPNLAPARVMAYTERVAIQFNQQRLIARLTTLFSALALLLASVGLYGVTAHNVARRTGEIGLRMALGADRAKVLRMVLCGALAQVAIGLTIGVPLAMLCGRWLAHLLYDVGRFDPLVLCVAVVTLCACALVAALVPARRAASIEPMEALRTE
jgi:predicted permease